MTINDQWVSDACTLPTAERPLRIAEFDDLFRSSLRAVDRTASTTALLTLAGAAEETARDLTARETACCSFFTFTFARADDGQLALEVAVPPTQVAVLDALTGRAMATAGLRA